MRIAVVGHLTYFENHFPENWRNRDDILCVDVDEGDYSFLVRVSNYRPDVTVFYRPELYSRQLLREIRGIRVAFLSEPIAATEEEDTAQTALREVVYSRMAWDMYHDIYYYDETKREAVRRKGWPIHKFRPLPIDTSVFKPRRGPRPIDVCFIGKATPHRIATLDFLRSQNVKFVWIAHGLSGRRLAYVLRRSKVVLNIHADAAVSVEPRIYLGACCGAVVLSERVGRQLNVLGEEILQYEGALGPTHIRGALNRYSEHEYRLSMADELYSLSFESFINSIRTDYRLTLEDCHG